MTGLIDADAAVIDACRTMIQAGLRFTVYARLCRSRHRSRWALGWLAVIAALLAAGVPIAQASCVMVLLGGERAQRPMPAHADPLSGAQSSCCAFRATLAAPLAATPDDERPDLPQPVALFTRPDPLLTVPASARGCPRAFLRLNRLPATGSLHRRLLL